jgi:hypothetical protein
MTQVQRTTSHLLVLLLLAGGAAGFPAVRAAPVAPVAPVPVAANPDSAAAVASAPVDAAVEHIPGASLSAPLRGEYLAGDPILVTVRVANTGTAVVTVPDLGARPWLVSFNFTRDGKGGSTTRRTTPPAADGGQTVSVPVRGQRQTLLEIPTSSTLPLGAHTLNVQVEINGKRETISSGRINIVAPAPSQVDLGWDVANDRNGWLAPWLHRVQDGGADLYLHQAPLAEPGQTTTNHFLTHIDSLDVAPQLTVSRASEAWNRYIVWPIGTRGLKYIRLQGQGQPATAVRTVEAPWPHIELAGRGATDTTGRLLQPLWVPAPKSGGEVRILTVDGRGATRTQRLTRLDRRPPDLGTTVDGSGSALFLVPGGPNLDLYAMRPDAAKPQLDGKDLPVPGKRIWEGAAGSQVVAARFGTLPSTDHFAGGIAILLAVLEGSTVTTHWLSLEGRRIIDLPWTSLPAGSAVTSLVPDGYLPAAVVIKSNDGTQQVLQGTRGTSIGAAATTGIVRTPDGRLIARSQAAGGPIAAAPLSLSPRTPG